MDPVVRLAHPQDARDLGMLQRVAREGMQDVRGGALRLAECAAVTDWLVLIDDIDSVVLVGTWCDAVVSYLVMHLSAAKDRGVITQAYVQAEARELGLGDTLVEWAIAAVRAAGLGGIEAVALPGDRETKNLFERAGLTARKLTVYKALPPTEG
ncbi:unannotated protein [freshwater metagenome]|uniref:Unannotated protein n=1 Tax=freshwater metagenome TaxID=449393 RepID=A0A6J7FEG6_9ZZZZ|nr:GNAT family N-acetyltransferase [Actinomycetota bacterium]